MIKKRQFFYSMTAEEYRQMFLGERKPVQKQSKYHAQKTEVDGIVFDSKKESKDYLQLKHLEDCGVIKNLRRQVSFELQPKYTNNKGEHIRAINYVADFVYEQDGKTVVRDTKCDKTDVFKMKRKLFEYKYPEYEFVIS